MLLAFKAKSQVRKRNFVVMLLFHLCKKVEDGLQQI